MLQDGESSSVADRRPLGVTWWQSVGAGCRMVTPLISILLLLGCDPFVVSQMVVTPSPSTLSPDSVRVQTNQIVATLAIRHGLQTAPWPYSCSIGRAKGTREGAWRAEDLWLTVCAAVAEPHQLQVWLQRPGFGWGIKGDSLRHELGDSLRAHFGTDVVAIED